MSEEEKEYFKVGIYYSNFLDKVDKYIIDLGIMKDMISVLRWHKDFVKNIAYIEVLIRVLKEHIKNYIDHTLNKKQHTYFYWDIEKYKKRKEEGGCAWGKSIYYCTKKEIEEDQDKSKKYEKQSRAVMYSGKMFDRPEEEGNFFDKEIDESFNTLFNLLSKKIKKP